MEVYIWASAESTGQQVLWSIVGPMVGPVLRSVTGILELTTIKMLLITTSLIDQGAFTKILGGLLLGKGSIVPIALKCMYTISTIYYPSRMIIGMMGILLDRLKLPLPIIIAIRKTVLFRVWVLARTPSAAVVGKQVMQPFIKKISRYLRIKSINNQCGCFVVNCCHAQSEIRIGTKNC